MSDKNPIKKNPIRTILLFLAIVVLGAMYIRYTWIRIENEHSDNLLQVARSTVAAISKADLATLQAIPSDTGKAGYQVIKASLISIIRANPEARFAYIFIEKNNKIFFLADSENEKSKDYSPPGQEYTEAKQEDKQPFADGKELITGPLTDRWGSWISVYIPVKDAATGKTMAVFGMDFYEKTYNNFLIYEVIESTVLLLFILLTLFIVFKIIAKNKLLKYEISERKQLDALFRDIIENNPMSVQIVDKEGFSQITNPAHTSLFGSAPPPDFSIFTDLQNKGIGEFIQLAKSGETVHLPDLYYNAHDIVAEAPDKSVWIKAVIFPLKDSNGKPERFVFMHEDISWRKLAEEALKNSLSVTDAVLESIHNGILVVNLNGAVLKTNAKFAEMWKIPAEIIDSSDDKTLLDFILVQLVDPSGFFEKVTEVYGKPEAESFDLVSFNDGRVFERISIPMFLEGAPAGRVWSFFDITGRKHAEEDLLASKLFTEEILNSIDVRVFWKDRNLVYLGCNEVFARDAGFTSQKDIIGKDDFMMGWHEQAEMYRSDDRLVIENGCPRLLIEESQTTPDGNLITLLTGKLPLRDLRGEIIGVLGTYMDITGRKQAEDEIREMGINYFGLFNSIKQAIYIQNPDLTFINVNQGAVDMYGYEREYFIGKTPGFLSAPGKNDLNKISELVALAFQGQPQNYEFWGIKYDGTVFLKDVWTVKGKYFGADVVITLASDISARRQAEEDLKISMARYRSLFENTGTSIIIIDEDATISLANDEFLRHTGYTRSETEGIKKWTEIVDSDDHARMLEQHTLRRVAPDKALPSYEFRYRTKSGEVRNALINIRMEEGTLKSIASLIDITLRKRTELEREALLEIMQGLVLTHDLKEFLGLVHRTVSKVIYAENFFVNLYNAETGLYEEVYSVDKFDPPAPPSELKDSICAYVFRTGIPLLLTQQRFSELLAQGEVKLVGANSASWLGVPLKTSGKSIGVMVVQDYDNPLRYTNGDTEFLNSIAAQVALAVERWQAEDLLRQSEERYRTIVGNIGEGIGFVNAREQFVFANRAAEEIFGVGPGELPGMNLEQFVSEEQFELLQKQTQSRVKGIRSVYENEILRPGGDKRTIIVTAVPQFDAEKGFTGTWGVFRDITGRKQMEEELRKSEERQRFIIESLPLAIYSAPVNSDIDTTWISGDVLKITGFDVEEYISAKDFWRKRLHPGDKSVVLRTFKNLPESKQAILEYRWKRKDGAYCWFSDRVVLIEHDSHKEYLGVIVDISGRKQAEEEISTLNAELEQRVKRRTLQLENANRELEDFSYSVAHNLRSPLRGIDGWSMALLEEYNHLIDEQGRVYIGRVRNEAQQMGNLIDSLLKLSRVMRIEMREVKVDLTNLVIIIEKRLMSEYPMRQFDFITEPGLKITGDPALLEIALTNLFSNACKFSASQPVARIEFGKMEKDGGPVFFIRDNGIGFDFKNAKNLFGAFQRMHKQSDFPGSGIGLATVKGIITRHGGRVWAESKPGEGAVFYFTMS